MVSLIYGSLVNRFAVGVQSSTGWQEPPDQPDHVTCQWLADGCQWLTGMLRDLSVAGYSLFFVFLPL